MSTSWILRSAPKEAKRLTQTDRKSQSPPWKGGGQRNKLPRTTGSKQPTAVATEICILFLQTCCLEYPNLAIRPTLMKGKHKIMDKMRYSKHYPNRFISIMMNKKHLITFHLYIFGESSMISIAKSRSRRINTLRIQVGWRGPP